MSTKLIKFHIGLCGISVMLVGALKSGGVWGQHPACCLCQAASLALLSLLLHFSSVEESTERMRRELTQTLSAANGVVGKKWSSQLMEAVMGTSWHCLATHLHLPPLLSCPCKRALSSLWAQGMDQSAFPPRADLSPCAQSQPVLECGNWSSKWCWQSWAQLVFVGEDLLPFCIAAPWAQWLVWPLPLIFCFAFVSTVRFLVHPEVSSSIPVF